MNGRDRISPGPGQRRPKLEPAHTLGELRKRMEELEYALKMRGYDEIAQDLHDWVFGDGDEDDCDAYGQTFSDHCHACRKQKDVLPFEHKDMTFCSRVCLVSWKANSMEDRMDGSVVEMTPSEFYRLTAASKMLREAIVTGLRELVTQAAKETE